MGNSGEDAVIKRVMAEQHQGHETRKELFIKLEQVLARPVVSFFTSFAFPVMIEDTDADMLEAVLQKKDLSTGLALLMSSPGGSGLAAERIINICRKHSGTGEYWAIVPSKAKSAASVICFGASKIMMRETSELGPIGPQIAISEKGVPKWFSLHNIVRSYDNLFIRAVKETGHLEPYLQQLANYDEREIAEFRMAIELSEDIAIKSLASGMMKGSSKTKIRRDIKVFLEPEFTMSHGRPIYAGEALKCGLRVESIGLKEGTWEPIYELYVRSNYFVSTIASKCIESATDSFAAEVTEHKP